MRHLLGEITELAKKANCKLLCIRLPKRLFHVTVSFSCLNVSHGSVVTQLRCGGISNNHQRKFSAQYQ